MAHDEGQVRIAKPQCIGKDGVEHRLQVGRRARDDAQNLGGCCLLIECFGKLATARIEIFLDRCHRRLTLLSKKAAPQSRRSRTTSI